MNAKGIARVILFPFSVIVYPVPAKNSMGFPYGRVVENASIPLNHLIITPLQV